MFNPTRLSTRSDSGSYTFRYVVPAAFRSLFGGRREITRCLRTKDKRLALRLARRLAAILDRFTFELAMSKDKPDGPKAYLTLAQIERTLADGSKITVQGAEVNSDEDRKYLAELLGTSTAAPVADTRNLEALIAAYFDEGKRAERWTDKTHAELDDIFQLALEVLGKEKAVATLCRENMNQLKAVLLRLPSNRNKKPVYRGKSALELASMKIPDADLLSVTSVNKALIRVSSLFKYGVQHGWLTHNPAEGMTIARKRRDDEEREQFTDAEVRQLLDSVLSGASGADRAPYMRWLPPIGAFTGLRLNEISQLEVGDFREVDGIQCISVNADGEGKRLKNPSAKRLVPIHPELVTIGLLNFVETQRKRGEKRLFPELSVGRDGAGQQASKWFQRYRERVGLTKPFHSLRHSFVNKLRAADVSPTVISDLVGHSRGESETEQRYMKQANVRALHHAVSRLSYRETDAASS